MLLTRFFRRRKTVAERIEPYTKPCGCGKPSTIVVNVPPTVDAVLAAQNFERQLKRRGLA